MKGSEQEREGGREGERGRGRERWNTLRYAVAVRERERELGVSGLTGVIPTGMS